MDDEVPQVQVDMRVRMSRFRLPPVESALAVGRNAPIGAKAMTKAFEEMLPGEFRTVAVDHATIEAIIVRVAHLRRVPQDKLIRTLVRHAEQLMSDTEMLHFDIRVEVVVHERLEV
jgi:hypothetical protein